ncbi:MAG: autotransporter domain-containing protein [Rhizobiales bacterium]|nr:autotransporter domain-containing protein [Hyphomicrobiales bacterium]
MLTSTALAGLGVAFAMILSATPAKAIDVASQADWNNAVAAVAAAGAGTTTTINIVGGFTLTSSLAPLQANNANVTVNITGNNQAIDGASTYQGIVVNGANGLNVNISNLAITNTAARGGSGQNGQNGYYSSGLSYGSGGGGGGGLGAGGGLLVGSGANVTITSVTFTGNTATGGKGGNGGVAQNAAADPVNGGRGGDGGTMNNAGGTGGGGIGGTGGTSGTQGTAGQAGTALGDGGGGGGGSGTTNSTSYTSNNPGGIGNGGGGSGRPGGDGVTNNNGSQGPGTDGGSGGNGGGAQGGAVYVATGGTLTILDTGISGATVTGGAGGSNGVGQGPSSINGSPGATGTASGAGIFLSGVQANIGVSSGTLTYADTIGGTGLTAGGVTTAINKTGAGTLVLSAVNTFTGNVNISGGTLSIAATANLGNAGNDVMIGNGGTLAVTATTTLAAARAFGISGTSTIDVAASTTTTLQGVISDNGAAGSLFKSGAGTLVLSAANTYTGATTVDAGTLRMGAANAIPAGTTLTANGTFDLNNFNLSVGSLAGAASGSVLLGTATLTAGSNNADTTFAGGISGAGGLTKVGSGALTLTGTSSYLGATTVSGGALIVNGAIASDVTAQSGSVLGGAGAVGPITVQSGATLAPGSSGIGTLTVNGNATLAAGSLTIIEVSALSADRITVNGTANLAGGLRLVTVGSGFSFGTSYTILSTTGGLTGTFNAVDVQGTFGPGIGTQVSYTGNDALLTLSANALLPLLPAGAPTNPTNVARGIDRAVAGGANSSAFLSVYLQSPGGMVASLNTLSGEAATGSQGAALGAASLFLNLMLDPMAGARGAQASGAGPSLIQMADLNAGRATPAARVEQGWSLWTKAFGQSGRTQGDAATGSAAASAGLYGVAAGADRRLSADTLVGFALAGGGTSYGLGGRGGGTGDLFQIGLYGSTRFGNGYVSAAAAYGWNGFDIKRNVNIAGPEVYSSRVTAQTYGGRLEAGWRFGQRAFGWTPYAALEAIGYSAPGYSETSSPAGGAFGLTFAAKSTASLRGELGVRLDGQTRVSETADLITYGRLAWAYQARTDRSIDAQFQTLANSAFTVFGARPSMHTALASVGAELRLAGGVKVSSSIEGELGERHHAIRANAGLRYEW